MKLHLPQSLFAIALATLSIAQAATVGTGVSYDNGKGSAPYSADENAHNMGTYTEGEYAGQPKSDTLLCWADSAANMIQFWQDTYAEYVTTAAPKGFNETKYTSPQGTRYLEVYEDFLTYSLEDTGGYQRQAFDWYFLNGWKDSLDKTLADRAPEEKYVDTVFDGAQHTYREDHFDFSTDLSTLTQTLVEVFSSQGQAVGLQVWQQDADDLLYNSRYHAITCWGFEEKDGVVSALYLTDSDDTEFGAFKVDVTVGESLPFDWLDAMPEMVLQTNDDIEGYGSSFVVGLVSLQSIATPTQYAKDAKDAPVPTLQGGEQTSVTQLMENTMVENVSRTGAGVHVGDGSTIVMLVSADEHSSLNMSANGAGGVGLDVEQGSLASLANLSVSGYEQGVNAEGKVYLYGDAVSVTNNTLPNGDGAGIRNTNYVEIKDATEVNITDNVATTGKGGGIYNEDVVSIINNGSVLFSGNQALQGNDIYNSEGGRVNIADNASVEFEGEPGANSVAIVNNGDLYLKSGRDTDGSVGAIQFSYASLNSSGGTTYVGLDMKGGTAETLIYFSDGDIDTPAFMQLSSYPESANDAAILDHVTVSPYEIAGAGAGTSSLKNAKISVANDFTLSNMKIDTSNSFSDYTTLATLSLDNLVIDLAGVELYSNTLDISNMFDAFGGMTINNVYLDASSLNLYEGWDATSFVTVNFGDSLKTLDEGTKLTLLLGNNMETSKWEYTTGGSVTFMGSAPIPEPTTGTLSLLALAGLASRRRRK